MRDLRTSDDVVERLVGAAGAAPSIHNTQPWRFRIAGPDLLELHADQDRRLKVADPMGRAMHLSCGAALFNLRLAARNISLRPFVWQLPDRAREPTLVAAVQLADGRPPTVAEAELFEAIADRHTSREPFSDRRIPESVQVALEQAASAEAVLLRMLQWQDAARVLDLISQADSELLADAEHGAELAQWIGKPPESGDGVPPAALGSKPAQRPAPVRDLGYQVAQATSRTASFEQWPQLAVLSTARDEPADWLRAGQALQRVLLTATRYGLATALLYQPFELHDQHGDRWWPWPERPQIIVRLGYGRPAAVTPRRPVADLIDEPGR